jgi:multiple sugar transport system substrate-binding protein
MKKVWIGMVAMGTVLGLLTACAPKAPETVTLNALFQKQAGYSEEDITAGTKEFEAANPGVTVNLTFVPYESLEQKIITSAEAGNFDVVISDGPFTAKFAKAGIVQAVPDVSAADKADIFPGALSSCVYQGKSYGMPWLSDVKYLFFNKKMLKAAGYDNPPKTWDELVVMAKALKAKKIVEYPLVCDWAQAEALICDYTIFSSVFGGAMADADSKPTLTNPGNVKALEFMAQMIKDGIVNPKSTEYLEPDVESVFNSGKAAFGINWTYQYNSSKDATHSQVGADVGIAPIPGEGSIPSATVNGGQPLSITKGSKHPVESWKYIQYLTGKAFQAKYSKNALPIWKSLFADPTVQANAPDVVPVAQVQYDAIYNRPALPYYSAFSNDLQVKIQEALLGKRPAAEALALAQKTAEDLAAKN